MKTKEQAFQIALHAYHSVPLYNRIAEENRIIIEESSFDDLPMVDKSYYVESGTSCLSSKYISDYLSRRLQWVRTSGSTGKFTDVYWKLEENRRSLLSLWLYRKKYYEISPDDKMCYFFPSDVGDKEFFQGKHFLGVSRKYIYDGNFATAYQKIVEYNPVWMILQPSLALLLCDEAEKSGEIPSSLRYIELTGEYLELSVRQRIQKIFCCHIANQYGTKEVNSIAYECPNGYLHCMSDNVYLEIYHENESEEQTGEICVTTLRNRVMPLVRFRLEDCGRLYRDMYCACGRHGDILELQAGRSNDWIVMRDGKKRHSYALLQIIHRINFETDGIITQYQIIQEEYAKFLVTIVLEDSEFFDGIASQITERFEKRLGESVEVEVKMTKRILPKEQTGKLACFLSKIKEERL